MTQQPHRAVRAAYDLGSGAIKLLVAEVMHQADTIASQPPAFEHKLKVNAERSRRASQAGCAGCKV